MASEARSKPNRKSSLISAKEAALSAASYLSELVPLSAKPMLEEVEMSDDMKEWIITLSYQAADGDSFAVFRGNKDYKTFHIDSSTGDVLSMKIRIVKS